MDWGDYVNDVQISSLRYCSSQDEICAMVVESFVRVDVPLLAQLCRRDGDSPNATPFGYTGSKLGETVSLKLNTRACGSSDLRSMEPPRRGVLCLLSEQQFVDCDAIDSACNGGASWMTASLNQPERDLHWE